MGDRATARKRGQQGLTLIEAMIALIIAAVAIVSIASGLLVSARVDAFNNEQQRVNLALQTFIENLDYVTPSGSPCGLGAISPPDAVVSTPGAINPVSHATALMTRAVEAAEVEEWIDRGMLFRITAVTYASGDTGEGLETFGSDCAAPELTDDAPYYPVARVEIQACSWPATDTVPPAIGPTECEDRTTVDSTAVVRGGRRA